MNGLIVRWPMTIMVVGLFLLVVAGCVVPGSGYGYDQGTGIGLGYYEPAGVDYSGWGGGYYVGPVRGGGAYGGRGGGEAYGGGRGGGAPHAYQAVGGRGSGGAPHAYQAAPASRPVPSIPSGGRSSGGGGSRAGSRQSN